MRSTKIKNKFLFYSMDIFTSYGHIIKQNKITDLLMILEQGMSL